MARPRKQGLEYFPFDCDFFSDERMVAIAGEFGLKGEIITIHLLCAVYRNGYFVEWGELMKFRLLKELPGVSVELLDAVVARLVRWGFFDEGLFNSAGVLTGGEIQDTYFNVTRKRVGTVEFPYVLGFRGRNDRLTGVSTEETGVFPAETPQIKGNYIKKPTDVGKESAAETPPASPSVNFLKKNMDACFAAKLGDEAAEYSEAIKLMGKDPKTLQNVPNENFQKKSFCTADYSKPVAQLLDICLRDEGYLDSVMKGLEDERIHKSREQVIAELKRFPEHLRRHGEDTPQRMARFKSHFTYYVVKKWKSEQNNNQQHGKEERMGGNDRQGGRAGLGRAEIAPATVVPADRGKSVI